MGGGDSGPAIAANDPDASLLIHALRREHQATPMPPDESLPAAVIDDFVAWIKAAPLANAGIDHTRAGFRAGRHWAFAAVRDREPPADPTGWSDHPIDRFVRELDGA